MLRKLKALASAVLAVAALAALMAPLARAEALFTVPGAGAKSESTLTMVKDGIEHEAHWTFDIYNTAKTTTFTLTCEEVRGNEFEHDGAAIGPEFADFTIVTPLFFGCTVAGTAAKVENKGCGITFTSGGQVDIVSVGIHKCEITKEPIVFNGGGCIVELGVQTITGVEYSTIVDGVTGKKAVTADLGGAENLTYEARGLLCPFGTTKNGVLTHARAVVKADEKAFGLPTDFVWEP